MNKIIDEIKEIIDTYKLSEGMKQSLCLLIDELRLYVELAEETIRCYYEDIEYGADPEGSYSNREIELIKQINKQGEAEVKDGKDKRNKRRYLQVTRPTE